MVYRFRESGIKNKPIENQAVDDNDHLTQQTVKNQ
jgi:hypothetical protein